MNSKLLLIFSAFLLLISPAKSQNYALFFAVDNYENYNDLKNPVKDAEALASELKERYGFEIEVVKDPNRALVIKKISEYSLDFISGKKDADGQLLLFFSGHGEYQEDFKSGYWIPTDGDPGDLQATSIIYNVWRPFINNISCNHILVVIDACYSGTFDFEIATRGVTFERPDELSPVEKMLQEHKTRKTRLYLTSGAKEKTPDNSEFTKQILAGFRAGGGQNGILSIDEIHAIYIRGVQPTPVFSKFGENEPGSTFLFFDQSKDGNLELLRLDLEAWNKAELLNSSQSYKTYLIKFPEGQFTVVAKDKIEQLERKEVLMLDLQAWKKAKDQNTQESYTTYLQHFPEGEFKNLAEAELKKLDPSYKGNTANTTPGQPLTPAGPRYGYFYRSNFLSEMEEVKVAENELTTFQREIQGYLQGLYKQYKEQKAAYTTSTKRGELSPRQQAQGAEKLQGLEADIVKAEQESQQKYIDKQADLFDPINAKVDAAVQAVSAAYGYTEIFDSKGAGEVVYAEPGCEVTSLLKLQLKMGGISGAESRSTSPSNFCEKIGLVNSNAVLEEMEEAKEAERKLNSLKQEYMKRGKEMVEDAQKANEEFVRVQILYSPEVKKEKEQDLQRRQNEIQAYEQQMLQDLEMKRQEWMAPVLAKLEQAVRSVAQENGFSIVIDTSESDGTTSAEGAFDITELVEVKVGI